MKRKGVVKGQTIQFHEPLDRPEGQQVEVVVEISAIEPVELEQYGIPPLLSRGVVVTNDMVNKILDELGT